MVRICRFATMNAISQPHMHLKIPVLHLTWQMLKALPLPLAQATKDQYDRMIELGLGDLDKSGIAELTFPGRGETA